jgi:hypothetical protein
VGRCGADLHLGASRRLSLHLDVLPERQQQLLGPLSAALPGFYLGGGTALALHLGHRQSVDFDWFTAAGIDDPMAFAALLKARGVAFETTSVAPGTLHGVVGGVRVSALSYRYPMLEPPTVEPGSGCELASLRDLACMKLAAVAQRGARRDFVDVAALLDRDTDLRGMLDDFSRKYGAADVTHVLMALTYFDDAEREPMPMLTRPVDWEALKERLRSLVRDWASANS